MNKCRADALAFARSLEQAVVSSTDQAQLFVIPPYPYISEVNNVLKDSAVKIGAQNMHWAEHGPWTGEVSASMLVDCGASMVELGHSERRTHFNETDGTVALKVQTAVAHNLFALVCIGDTREQFERGHTRDALQRQIRAALSKIEQPSKQEIAFAYEPVWAIGDGGIPADPEFADQQHQFIKAFVSEEYDADLSVLYGGSVSMTNCLELAAKAHIDGLFIGRAAWEVEGFITIAESVSQARS